MCAFVTSIKDYLLTYLLNRGITLEYTQGYWNYRNNFLLVLRTFPRYYHIREIRDCDLEKSSTFHSKI